MAIREFDWSGLAKVTRSETEALRRLFRALGPVFAPSAPWRAAAQAAGVETVRLEWVRVASLPDGLGEARNLAVRWKLLRSDGAGGYLALDLPLVLALCGLALGQPVPAASARPATVQEAAVAGAVAARLIRELTGGAWQLLPPKQGTGREHSWGNVVWSFVFGVCVAGRWGRALLLLPTSTGSWPRGAARVPEAGRPAAGDGFGAGDGQNPAEEREGATPRGGRVEDAAPEDAGEVPASHWHAEWLPVELAVGYGPLGLPLAQAVRLEIGGGILLAGRWLRDRVVRLLQDRVWWSCRYEAGEALDGIQRLVVEGGPFMDEERVESGSLSAGGGDERVLDAVTVDAVVELGRIRLSAADVLSLGPGAVLELDRPVGAEAELRVGGVLVARGRIVDVEGRLGFQVTEKLR